MWWKTSRAAAEEVRHAGRRAAQGDFGRCDSPSLEQNGKQTVLLDLTAAPVRSDDGTVRCLLIEARAVTETGGEVFVAHRARYRVAGGRYA